MEGADGGPVGVDLDGKRVFLAGATGLAGSAILRHILESHPRSRVRAVYRGTGPLLADARVEYVRGDLRAEETCRELAKGCDCAIMAAASTSGANVLATRPWEQVNDNVVMNARMLEAFHFEGVKRVVFVGSASLYQEFDGWIREDELDWNRDPHPAHFGVGWVMRFVEKLCEFWHRQSGMEIVIARASNLYGPFAKFDPETSNFIPAIIRKAVARMDPFEVWGSPDVTRDVLYSEDFAEAVGRMLAAGDVRFDVFNIGSGEKTTVAEVVDFSLKYSSHNPSEVVYSKDKPATIKLRALDCGKARRTLGWRPRHTAEEGIAKTVRWWNDHKDRWTR